MELSETKFRKARTAKLAIRCCPVQGWCVEEEFHKILKSGCQAERYRLAAEGLNPYWLS